jgi:hypothetical protein
VNPPITLTMVLVLLGQASPSSAYRRNDSAVRLEFMKKSLATFNLHSIDDPQVAYHLKAEPVLRFTDPAGGPKDGAIFFWVGDDDRPVAAVQIYLTRKEIWHQEFSLLATSPLVATSSEGPDWAPSKPVVEFKPLPGAPKPAQAAEPRLRQMQALAQEFSAESMIPPSSWNQLRRLPRPLARYGKPETEVIDGALFAFVLATDPEVYLLLEARAGKDGPEWQYALAPMTVRAVKAARKGEEVWSLPRRMAESWNPTAAYHFRDLPAGASEDPSKAERTKP